MLIKTKGIVLRTKKYSETSVIVDMFTELKGLRSYIVSGVRTQNARMSASLFQIMTPLDIVAYHRDDQELTRLKEVKPSFIFHSIPFDIRKGAVGMFMTEVARKTIHGHEEHPELFDFLLNTFVFLDETTKPFANLHLHFLLNLTDHLGFQPGGTFSDETPYFDLQEGFFTDLQPVHAHSLSPHFSQKISQLLQSPAEKCHEVPLSREERKFLLNQLLNYYRLHIDHFPTIHSHEVLEEVLG